LAQSYPLLDDVVEILREHTAITIRVEGHTDSRGRDSYNKKLSDQRAGSVRIYLIERGIESSRIDSIGFGEERPIDDNSTEAGRATNRRVEIHITKQ
jgi:OOP family OmpA-OmpF porin